MATREGSGGGKHVSGAVAIFAEKAHKSLAQSSKVVRRVKLAQV